jgi:hypothetical protein
MECHSIFFGPEQLSRVWERETKESRRLHWPRVRTGLLLLLGALRHD